MAGADEEVDAPALAPLRRRGNPASPALPSSASAPSARSLLLTILGEFVLPVGEAWTSTLLEAMATVGVETKTTRQALARSADAGLLEANRIGRRTCWRLTGYATELLTEGRDRIYSFGVDHAHWDGRWLLVFITVPETSRHLRYRLRNRFGWAGLAPIGAGAWLSPWPSREDEVRRILAELGVGEGAASFVGELGAIGDAAAVVAAAWNLEQLEADYEGFIDRQSRVAPGSGDEHFAALTRLVHEWRHFPAADPGLPPRLLPQPWSGAAAARWFHQLHDRWDPAARSWWASIAG